MRESGEERERRKEEMEEEKYADPGNFSLKATCNYHLR